MRSIRRCWPEVCAVGGFLLEEKMGGLSLSLEEEGGGLSLEVGAGLLLDGAESLMVALAGR